jgi:hypothetical protein
MSNEQSPLLQKLLSSNSDLTDATSALIPKYRLPSDSMDLYKLSQLQLQQQQLQQQLLQQQLFNTNFYNSLMNSGILQNKVTAKMNYNVNNNDCLDCVQNKLVELTTQAAATSTNIDSTSKSNLFASSNSSNLFSSMLPLNDIFNNLGTVIEKLFGSKYMMYAFFGVILTVTVLLFFCYIYCCCCSKKNCLEKLFCCCCCSCFRKNKKKMIEKKKIDSGKKIFCFA